MIPDDGAPSLAIFLHDLSATGVVRNALAISAHAAARGWRVAILAVRAEGVLAEAPAGVALIGLLPEGARRDARAIEMARAIPRLRRALRAQPFDLILSAGNHAHLACWAACRGLARPKRVYRISNDISSSAGGLANRPRMALRRWTYRLLTADAAALVTVSARLREDRAMRRAAASGKLTVIANGVDVAQVRRLSREPFADPWFDAETPVVVAAGRLVAQKNFATLIEALAIARRTRSVRLYLLGAGTAEQRSALESQARALGVGASIRLVGSLPNPFPVMARASVVAVPSFWEGSPNVLLEAMACGAPVVASRSAGNAAEILDHDRFGLLIDPRDPAGLAEALLRQLDPATRIAPCDRAEAFDRRHALDAYLSLFAGLRNA